MTAASGKIFGIVGALGAFPRRLAAREIERQHAQLRRGVTRRTSHVVFGRTLLERCSEADIEARFDIEQGSDRVLLSENGFLRLLGLAQAPAAPALSRQSLLDQSRLEPRTLALLSLFDAFEHDWEPYSFRDLILARKYAGLIATGASWGAIARSIHRSGPVASLTALSLHVEGNAAIYAQHHDGLSELDGQLLLALGANAPDLDELFAVAESLEGQRHHAEAAAQYLKCLDADPADSIAAFNRANCLRAAGMPVAEVEHAYMLAIKRDPEFVEAWFNLAGLASSHGQMDRARSYLRKAIALDGQYADAVYNLATLEYDAGNLSEARRWWLRYLDLDDRSEWARLAARGVQVVDLELGRKSVG